MSVDISKTIAPKSDQLNADDLMAGPRTITITRITGNENEDQQPVSIFFEGDNGKPYKPGLSMRRVLLQVWGPDAAEYIGRSLTLYTDPEVMFGGIKVGGIRISHASHISSPREMMLTAKRGRKNQYTVHPLQAQTKEVALEQAKDAAQQGTEAFRTFYNSDLGKRFRPDIKANLDEFQKIASEADEANKPGPNLAQKLSGEEVPPPSDDEPHWTDDHNLDEAFAGSESWQMGEQAHADGQPRTSCPFTPDDDQSSLKAADWLAAWDLSEQTKPQKGTDQ